MIIFPAIDLYEGKTVRLLKGDYRQMTVYSEHPEEIGAEFAAAGATHVHLVDLEGARDGGTPNLSVVARIANETGLFTEVGGGVRDRETIERYLACGVDRVSLGTAAVQNETLLREALAAYGDKIAVGADVKDGRIAVKGWLEKTDWSLEAFARHMEALGVRTLICTDVSRDGALGGTNRELYRKLSQSCGVNITASGGVSSLEDIRALRSMGLYGAIVGKAYYTGDIRLKEAIEAAL